MADIDEVLKNATDDQKKAMLEAAKSTLVDEPAEAAEPKQVEIVEEDLNDLVVLFDLGVRNAPAGKAAIFGHRSIEILSKLQAPKEGDSEPQNVEITEEDLNAMVLLFDLGVRNAPAGKAGILGHRAMVISSKFGLSFEQAQKKAQEAQKAEEDEDAQK